MYKTHRMFDIRLQDSTAEACSQLHDSTVRDELRTEDLAVDYDILLLFLTQAQKV